MATEGGDATGDRAPATWTSRRWWTPNRMQMLFFRIFGTVGIIQQMATHGLEKPTLIIIFAGMLGLPTFLNRDRRRGETGNGGDA